MIQLRDRQQLTNAITKARRVKPNVRVSCFGFLAIGDVATMRLRNVFTATRGNLTPQRALQSTPYGIVRIFAVRR